MFYSFTDLNTVVSRVEAMEIQGDVAFQLRQNLGLSNAAGAEQETEDVQQICLEWLHSSTTTHTLEGLVQALMYTRSLGRLVSRLLPHCKH